MVIEMGMRAVMIIIVIVLILIISYGNCHYIYLLLYIYIYIYQFNATEYKVTPIIIVRVSSKCNRSPNAD